MMMTTRRSIVFRISMVLTGLFLAVSFLFVSGCGHFSSAKSETGQLYKGVGGSSGTYQKMMVALPLENNAQWTGIDLNAAFLQELKRAIEAGCNDVHIILPGSPDFPAGFNAPVLLADGELDGIALAAAGQASGINLVLSGRLAGIQHVTEDRGIFWFERIVHLARIQMEITIYHTGTGAKIVDRTVFHNIEITEAEGELIDAEEMPKAIPLNKALTEISKTMGKTACIVLKYIPWEGYVSSVEGDRIVLSAGESCGLKKGRELTVYSMDEVTIGESAQRFLAPGKNIARITVTAVYPDRSEAVLKEGGPVLPGSAVRIE